MGPERLERSKEPPDILAATHKRVTVGVLASGIDVVECHLQIVQLTALERSLIKIKRAGTC
jgi:hypothetical protein